jgi:hypothetical protein
MNVDLIVGDMVNVKIPSPNSAKQELPCVKDKMAFGCVCPIRMRGMISRFGADQRRLLDQRFVEDWRYLLVVSCFSTNDFLNRRTLFGLHGSGGNIGASRQVSCNEEGSRRH